MTREEEMLHLNNMAIEIDQIAGYTEDMDYEDFTSSEETREIVNRSLKNIGEAADMLRSNDDWMRKYPDLSLDVLARLRETSYEAPLEMDQHGVWGIVSKDLREIKECIYAAQEKLERLEADDEDVGNTTV